MKTKLENRERAEIKRQQDEAAGQKDLFVEGERAKQKSLFQDAEIAGARKDEIADAKKEWIEKGTDSRYFRRWFGNSKVVDENGSPLGELVEILETGANDVYVVRDDSGREILLPNIPSVILDLDIDSRIMRVHLLEGL